MTNLKKKKRDTNVITLQKKSELDGRSTLKLQLQDAFAHMQADSLRLLILEEEGGKCLTEIKSNSH